MNFRRSKGLIFGIYPGSTVGIDPGSGIITGPTDEPGQIMKASNRLQVANAPFIVRDISSILDPGKVIM